MLHDSQETGMFAHDPPHLHCSKSSFKSSCCVGEWGGTNSYIAVAWIYGPADCHGWLQSAI